MKNNFKLLIVIIVSMALLAACSSQSTKKTESTKDSSRASETTSSTTKTASTEEIDVTKLYGDWESEGEAETYYMSIKEAGANQIEFADNLAGKDSQILTIDTNADKTITALTSDKANRYQFIFSEDNKITSLNGVNTELKTNKNLVGLSKPIVYRKINK